ncbi:MAG: hypothetical protein PVF82_21305 [Gammaproteobacteria bacterium]|jgi:hypothetical protein
MSETAAKELYEFRYSMPVEGWKADIFDNGINRMAEIRATIVKNAQYITYNNQQLMRIIRIMLSF